MSAEENRALVRRLLEDRPRVTEVIGELAEPVAPEHVGWRHDGPGAGVTARLKAASTSGTWRKIDPVVPPSVCGERLRMCGNSSLSMTLM
jgi:hypothetical protein